MNKILAMLAVLAALSSGLALADDVVIDCYQAENAYNKLCTK